MGRGMYSSGGSTSDGKAWVHICNPDGTELPILDTGRIFQVSGTNVTELSEHISGRIFRAFLDSHPADCSLSAFKTFAGAQNEH